MWGEQEGMKDDPIVSSLRDSKLGIKGEVDLEFVNCPNSGPI